MKEGVDCVNKEKNKKNNTFIKKLRKDWQLIAIGAWPTLLIVVFSYLPMFGVLYAFQKVGRRTSFWENKWVGLQWFEEFFSSYYWKRLIGNTLSISVSGLILNTVAAILFALIINELRDGRYKKISQSFSYFPYFISVTVMVGLLKNMMNPETGIINIAMQKLFGLPATNYFMEQSAFLPMYLLSGLWQGLGWSTIIYLGAISGIDPALYEVAELDGCGRLGKIRYITLPGIKPIIVTLLILDIGRLLSVGYQKVLLMRTSLNTQVTDIISLHVYERGIISANFGYGAAVGLMNSVVNLILLIMANKISKKLTEQSLF